MAGDWVGALSGVIDHVIVDFGPNFGQPGRGRAVWPGSGSERIQRGACAVKRYRSSCPAGCDYYGPCFARALLRAHALTQAGKILPFRALLSALGAQTRSFVGGRLLFPVGRPTEF